MSFFPTQATVEFGGRVVTDLSNTFWITAGAGTDLYTTLRTLNNVQYQIPDATNLEVIGARFTTTLASTAVTLGYSDNAVTNVTAGSVTNEVQIINTTGDAVHLFPFVAGTSLDNPVSYHLDWRITEATTPGKFVFIRVDSATVYAWLLCREF